MLVFLVVSVILAVAGLLIIICAGIEQGRSTKWSVTAEYWDQLGTFLLFVGALFTATNVLLMLTGTWYV